MKYIENRLGRQLILILVLIFDFFLLIVGFVIPKLLNPLYESSVYIALQNPMDFISKDNNQDINSNMAYLYIEDSNIYESNNYNKIINVDSKYIMNACTNDYGKIEFDDVTYYYASKVDNNVKKIVLSSGTYLKKIHNDLVVTVISLFLIAFLIICFIIFLWSSIVVKKIEKLKAKIDNIDNDNFNHNIDFKLNDEIKTLANSIEDARIYLKTQEEYKNSMYQNISHDFKTPLTVIKSYVEAVEDGAIDKDEAMKVIKDQTIKLEKKVYSLLYLNKLEYLKDRNKNNYELMNINDIVLSSVEKFKFERKDVNFITSLDNSKFNGTSDLWESIIDNILNNFIRYAKSCIKVTIKNNKITLYNDGPCIDDNLIEDLFNPFKKGIKGKFGLGLSIVKKTLNLLNYDINIVNNKKGVSFIIKKKTGMKEK